ncbi:MAG: fibronectin type III domain-containing protein [Candidatus Eisenbacteria bacterium]
MQSLWLVPLAAVVLLSGCDHERTRIVAPRDLTPPAAPRGLFSVTGDGEVELQWYANTESDVVGYRVYKGPCADGESCPYDLVGATTGRSYVVSGLTNGTTRYYAVAAYDRAGNESDLTYEDIFDTPRPEGFGRALTNATDAPATAGYDFSAFTVRPWDDTRSDIYFSVAGGALRMAAPFTDTDLQDAGYAASLDAVDYAPSAGWSPTGTVELIVGHCYVARIESAGVYNFAKFRVTSLSGVRVVFDWAYQTDPNNGELMVAPSREEGPRVRRAAI